MGPSNESSRDRLILSSNEINTLPVELQQLPSDSRIARKPLPQPHSRRTYQRVPSYTPSRTDDDSEAAPPTDINPLKGFPTSKPMKQGEMKHRKFLGNWHLEIAACIFSVACMVALFFTLYHYQGNPSPDWPSYISLNTLVSILSTGLKTSVLLVVAEGLGQLKWTWYASRARPLADFTSYDDASRGPWGALKFLAKLRSRHLLSSLGAVITVFALGVDPFAQQILSYHSCQTLIRSTVASLPRTNLVVDEFFSDDLGLIAQVISRSLPNDTLGLYPSPLEAQRAVMAGIYAPSTHIRSGCIGDNCTWDSDYSTIAWCSECKDISDTVVFTQSNLFGRQSQTFSSGFAFSLPDQGVFLNYTDQETFMDKPAAVLTPEINQMLTNRIDLFTSPRFTFLYGNPEVINTTNRQYYAYDHWEHDINKSWQSRGYGATSCTLKPCVKTFRAAATASNDTETLIDSSSSWGLSGWNISTDGDIIRSLGPGYPADLWNLHTSIATLNTGCVNAEEKSTLESLRYNLSMPWAPYNDSIEWFEWPLIENTTTGGIFQVSDGNIRAYFPESTANITAFPESMVHRGCIYKIDMVVLQAISYFLRSTLNGTISTGVTAYEPDALVIDGPQVAQVFFNFGNCSFESIEAKFTNISNSLTDYMRTNGQQNLSEPAVGQVFQEKTCIRVRWQWLAYPLSLVLANLIFFVFTITTTRPTAVNPRIWKTSPMPYLFHPLVKEDGAAVRVHGQDAESIEGMNKLAKGFTARLTATGNDVALLHLADHREWK